MQHKFIERLLSWYRAHREKYFFREDRTPYKVWVAEVVLHQTRIQAALGPLKRFLTIFPDLESLARATEEQVLNAFRGLGYYARGKNLLKGARYIIDNFNGVFPSKPQLLQQVPSIGPYTAGMLASVCFGEKVPVLDGNIKRVLSRFLMIPYTVDDNMFLDRATDYLEKIFSKLKFSPGNLNEAMMELGQKICLKNNPLCTGGNVEQTGRSCPIGKWCAAYLQGQVNRFPVLGKKSKKTEVNWHLFIIRDDKNSILLERWWDFYFLKGQIGFPSLLEFTAEKKLIPSWFGTEERGQWETKDIRLAGLLEYPEKITALPTFDHTITRHKIKISPYLLNERAACEILPVLFKWNLAKDLYPAKGEVKDRFSSKTAGPDLKFRKVSYSNVRDYLVSSAMLKAWNRAEVAINPGKKIAPQQGPAQSVFQAEG